MQSCPLLSNNNQNEGLDKLLMKNTIDKSSSSATIIFNFSLFFFFFVNFFCYSLLSINVSTFRYLHPQLRPHIKHRGIKSNSVLLEYDLRTVFWIEFAK